MSCFSLSSVHFRNLDSTFTCAFVSWHRLFLWYWFFKIYFFDNFLIWIIFINSLLSLLPYYFRFMLWFFGHKACEILVPHQGSNLYPPALESEVLITGPLGKSLRSISEFSPMAHTGKEVSRWYPAIVLLTRTFVKIPTSFSCFLTSFPQSLSLFSPFTKDLKQIKFYWARQFVFFSPPVGSGFFFFFFFFFWSTASKLWPK